MFVQEGCSGSVFKMLWLFNLKVNILQSFTSSSTICRSQSFTFHHAGTWRYLWTALAFQPLPEGLGNSPFFSDLSMLSYKLHMILWKMGMRWDGHTHKHAGRHLPVHWVYLDLHQQICLDPWRQINPKKGVRFNCCNHICPIPGPHLPSFPVHHQSILPNPTQFHYLSTSYQEQQTSIAAHTWLPAISSCGRPCALLSCQDACSGSIMYWVWATNLLKINQTVVFLVRLVFLSQKEVCK